MEDIAVPAVYILSRITEAELVPSVLRALGITPLHTVFITDNRAMDLAIEFSDPIDILKTKNQEDAVILGQSIFEDTHMPCLVIGDAALLDGIYPDGKGKPSMSKVKKRKGAPMVEVDRAELGDKRLDYKENYHREKELALKKASRARIHGQEELEGADRSAGPRLYYTEIIKRIHNLNPAIHVLEGSYGSVALYRRKFWHEMDPEEFNPDQKEFFWFHKYVGGMEKNWLPEYAHVLLDSSNLPTKEIRGWRSVLLALIKNHAISIEGAIREFGDPASDQRSGRWKEQLWEFRNKKEQ